MGQFGIANAATGMLLGAVSKVKDMKKPLQISGQYAKLQTRDPGTVSWQSYLLHHHHTQNKNKTEPTTRQNLFT